MSDPDRELLQECQGIIKTMHTGFSAYTHIAEIILTPRCYFEETGRYDLAMELCSVLNALSK